MGHKHNFNKSSLSIIKKKKKSQTYCKVAADFRNFLLSHTGGASRICYKHVCVAGGGKLSSPLLWKRWLSAGLIPCFSPACSYTHLQEEEVGRSSHVGAGGGQKKLHPYRGCMGLCQTGMAAPPHPELPRRKILSFATKIRIPSNAAMTATARREAWALRYPNEKPHPTGFTSNPR